MLRSTDLPLTPSHAAAMAQLAELRAEAERHHLARSLPRRRRPLLPAAVIAALVDSLIDPVRRPARGRSSDGDLCVAC